VMGGMRAIANLGAGVGNRIVTSLPID